MTDGLGNEFNCHTFSLVSIVTTRGQEQKNKRNCLLILSYACFYKYLICNCISSFSTSPSSISYMWCNDDNFITYSLWLCVTASNSRGGKHLPTCVRKSPVPRKVQSQWGNTTLPFLSSSSSWLNSERPVLNVVVVPVHWCCSNSTPQSPVPMQKNMRLCKGD